MLHKIIYKNFKSNIRKYILFFVSNIIAVAELFIFWGLNDVVVRAVTEPSIMMGIKSDFMIAVGLITGVTILLMVFSMRYYIKLRAKDYGTFIMLGMKKKMSYMLLFAEHIIGCIGSFNWYFVRKSAPIWNFILLKSIQSSDYYITKSGSGRI